MSLSKVRYHGLSNVRELTVDQLKAHGISVPKDLVWADRADPELYNRKTIIIDGMSPALEDLLREDGHFSITEVAEDGTDGHEIVAVSAVNPDDTAGVVVDQTNGQISVNPDADVDESAKQTAKEKAKEKPA